MCTKHERSCCNSWSRSCALLDILWLLDQIQRRAKLLSHSKIHLVVWLCQWGTSSQSVVRRKKSYMLIKWLLTNIHRRRFDSRISRHACRKLLDRYCLLANTHSRLETAWLHCFAYQIKTILNKNCSNQNKNNNYYYRTTLKNTNSTNSFIYYL